MIHEFPDGIYNFETLHIQLQAAGIPGYQNVGRMVKRRDASGVASVVPPYIGVITAGDLTTAERNQVAAVLAAHDPTQKTSEQLAREQAIADDLADLEAIRTVLDKDDSAITTTERQVTVIRALRRLYRKGRLA